MSYGGIGALFYALFLGALFFFLLYMVVKAAVRDGIVEARRTEMPEENKIAQAICPECGAEHDIDCPKCPACGRVNIKL